MSPAGPLLTLSVRRPADDFAPSNAPLDRRAVAYDVDGVPVAYGANEDGHIWLAVPDVACFHLAAGSTVITVVDDDNAATAPAVLDAYYGTALPLAVQAAHGLEVLHGSAILVRSRDRVVAFCGTSGSGKSTLARALGARGHGYWADDAVAFTTDGERAALSVGLPFLARNGRLDSDFVADFAWKRAPLVAIFLLDPSPEPPEGEATVRVERIAPANALRALLENAFRFQPEEPTRRRETLQAYLDLAASVPLFRARFARDLEQVPKLLDELEHAIPDGA